jgi:MGT family glycosyltransferase
MYLDLYLAVIPPAMEEFPRLPVPAVQRVRYVPWDGDVASVPEPSPTAAVDRTGRPTVLVTLGTVYNHHTELLGRFLEALAGEDVNVICTLGDDADPAVLGSPPDNVRFERYLPHSSILPHCQALLCHAGFNTVMGALVAGVPLVCVPLGSDQAFNAQLCVDQGFGVALEDEDATPERIRNAVRTVIAEPSYSASVAAFRQEMAGQPGLPAVVRRLEKLVATRRAGRGLVFGT